MTDYGAYNQGLTCKNPSCASHGRPHPNCRCYPGLAHGGMVCDQKLPHARDCAYYAEGGEVEDNQEFHANPELATEHAVANNGLLHALTKAGYSQSPNSSKPTEDFINSSMSGRNKVDSHMDNLVGKDKIDLDPDIEKRDALKDHLTDLENDPMPLLNVGGDLRSQLPKHSVHLAALAGRAVTHLSNLKPMGKSKGPLDEPMAPGKIDNARYDRNLNIAENPMLALKHAKNNTLHPEDLQTLSTIYPELTKSFADKATGQIIDAKTNGQDLSHKERQGIGKLLGRPLSVNQTPEAKQAIMKANAGAQAPSQGQPGKPGHQSSQQRATKTAVEQSDKQAGLLATPTQAMKLNDKS